MRTFFISIALLSFTGCAGFGTSRWAMDDEVYAKKYSRPYSSNDAEKAARMIKQASDARFVAGKAGSYGGLGLFGLEVGVAGFPTSFSEVRLGGRANGVRYSAPSGDFSLPLAGADLGIRVHTPTRLAPFAGVGTFIGGGEVRANNDSIDNDHDGRVDEFDEEDSRFDWSFYPEVGAHFWLNSRSRLSVFGQYHFTPMPDNKDYAYVGLQLLLIDGIRGLFADSE